MKSFEAYLVILTDDRVFCYACFQDNCHKKDVDLSYWYPIEKENFPVLCDCCNAEMLYPEKIEAANKHNVTFTITGNLIVKNPRVNVVFTDESQEPQT